MNIAIGEDVIRLSVLQFIDSQAISGRSMAPKAKNNQIILDTTEWFSGATNSSAEKHAIMNMACY